MTAPLVPSRSRWSFTAFVLLAIAACGDRTGLSFYGAVTSGAVSGVSAGTGAHSGVSSGAAATGAVGSAGSAAGASSGTTVVVADAGPDGGPGIPLDAEVIGRICALCSRGCVDPNSACPVSGETNCGGCCVDEQTDPSNCGACGTLCSGDEICQAGRCACANGESLCGFACVNEQTDPSDCGGCGMACAVGATCQHGVCGSCPAGETVCGGACVNEQTDPANCGTCGVTCLSGKVCTAGACACPGGETLCGLGPAAACTNLLTDPNNCGGCAAPCAAGQVCESGKCLANPPSCAPGGAGMTDCGPGGSGTESCCTSLEVTGGTFYRTYANDGVGVPTSEADPAAVSSFRLDKYLVTVGRFRQFVDAALPADGGAGWLPAPGSGKHTHLNGGNGLVDVGAPAAAGTAYEPGWVASDDTNIAPTSAHLSSCSPYSTWTSSAGGQENLPINCVTWQEAYAFCIWDGGFLPSTAEWEYAAAGGSQQREYPWGSTAGGPQYAISGAGDPCDGETGCSNYPGGSCPGSSGGTFMNIAPVGYAQLGAGLWGQLDLAGDAWEWNLDWYNNYVTPSSDGAILTIAKSGNRSRVLRGGAFTDALQFLVPPAIFFTPPTARAYCTGDIGFRCARTP